MILFQTRTVLIPIQEDGGRTYSTKLRLNELKIVGRQNAKTVNGLVKNQCLSVTFKSRASGIDSRIIDSSNWPARWGKNALEINFRD
jgi:hypothetical protein